MDFRGSSGQACGWPGHPGYAGLPLGHPQRQAGMVVEVSQVDRPPGWSLPEAAAPPGSGAPGLSGPAGPAAQREAWESAHSIHDALASSGALSQLAAAQQQHWLVAAQSPWAARQAVTAAQAPFLLPPLGPAPGAAQQQPADTQAALVQLQQLRQLHQLVRGAAPAAHPHQLTAATQYVPHPPMASLPGGLLDLTLLPAAMAGAGLPAAQEIPTSRLTQQLLLQSAQQQQQQQQQQQMGQQQLMGLLAGLLGPGQAPALAPPQPQLPALFAQAVPQYAPPPQRQEQQHHQQQVQRAPLPAPAPQLAPAQPPALQLQAFQQQQNLHHQRQQEAAAQQRQAEQQAAMPRAAPPQPPGASAGAGPAARNGRKRACPEPAPEPTPEPEAAEAEQAEERSPSPPEAGGGPKPGATRGKAARQCGGKAAAGAARGRRRAAAVAAAAAAKREASSDGSDWEQEDSGEEALAAEAVGSKVEEARRKNREAQQRFRERQRQAAQQQQRECQQIEAEMESIERENDALLESIERLEDLLAVRDSMLATFNLGQEQGQGLPGEGASPGPGAASDAAAAAGPRPGSPSGAAAEPKDAQAAAAAVEGEANAAAAAAATAAAAVAALAAAAAPGAPPSPSGAPGGAGAEEAAGAAPSPRGEASGLPVSPFAAASSLEAPEEAGVEEVQPMAVPVLEARDPELRRAAAGILTDEDYTTYYKLWQVEMKYALEEAEENGLTPADLLAIDTAYMHMHRVWQYCVHRLPNAIAALAAYNSPPGDWSEVYERLAAEANPSPEALVRLHGVWRRYAKQMAAIAQERSAYRARLASVLARPGAEGAYPGMQAAAQRALEVEEVAGALEVLSGKERDMMWALVHEWAVHLGNYHAAKANVATMPYIPSPLQIISRVLRRAAEDGRLGRALSTDSGMLMMQAMNELEEQQQEAEQLARAERAGEVEQQRAA